MNADIVQSYPHDPSGWVEACLAVRLHDAERLRSVLASRASLARHHDAVSFATRFALWGGPSDHLAAEEAVQLQQLDHEGGTLLTYAAVLCAHGSYWSVSTPAVFEVLLAVGADAHSRCFSRYVGASLTAHAWASRDPAVIALLTAAADAAVTPAAAPAPPAAFAVAAHEIDIVCVRHGETEWNVKGILQGHEDVDLNDLGVRQAVAAGAHLRHWGPFVSVVSSDLQRAARTAALIADALISVDGDPLVVNVDSRLRETHLGAWQCSSWSAVNADPAQAANAAAFDADVDVRAGGFGESRRSRFARMAAGVHAFALRTLLCSAAAPDAAARPALRALLVSHGGALDDLARLSQRIPFDSPCPHKKTSNAAIARLRFRADWARVRAAAASARADRGAPNKLLAPARPDDSTSAVSSSLPVKLDDVEDAVLWCFGGSQAICPHAGRLEPAAAASALGSWEMIEWGSTTHLKGVEGSSLGADFIRDGSGGSGAGAAPVCTHGTEDSLPTTAQPSLPAS